MTKFALTAALLSVALAAPISAQSPSDAPPAADTGTRPGGPHGSGGSHGPDGPHGRMAFGPGRAIHRVEAVPNAPFTAQFTETGTFTDREGKQEQRSSTSILYRDSQGRIREEITLPAPPPRPPAASDNGSIPAAPRAPRTIVTIVDPVAGTIIHLNADRQTAYVQTVPAEFFSRMRKREERREAGQAAHKRPEATTTDLGSKVIAGVSAKGEQTTITVPAREGGSAHTITHQSWFSDDLKFEVSSVETSDRGTHSGTLSSFDKTEPNPSLFQVPAGFTTTSVPDRQSGDHHPGGPGGRHGGDAAPPPPAM